VPIVAGIDEAGYGPMLGPLVVACCTLGVPDAAGDLWELLEGSVARSASEAHGRVVIADSKKVFTQGSVTRLEETALTLIRIRAGRLPSTFASLKTLIGVKNYEPEDGSLPWRDEVGLPLAASKGEIRRLAAHLAGTLCAKGCESLGYEALPVFPGEFNRAVALTGNKAEVLFDRTAVFIRDLWERFGKEELRLFVDRQGMRKGYGPGLMRALPGALVESQGERGDISEYLVWSRDRTMRITFATRAEDRYLPVAAASCLAKYVRELAMARFNRYWSRKAPHVKATAGYPNDAGRFLDQTCEIRRELGIPDELLVRCR